MSTVKRIIKCVVNVRQVNHSSSETSLMLRPMGHGSRTLCLYRRCFPFGTRAGRGRVDENDGRGTVDRPLQWVTVSGPRGSSHFPVFLRNLKILRGTEFRTSPLTQENCCVVRSTPLRKEGTKTGSSRRIKPRGTPG